MRFGQFLADQIKVNLIFFFLERCFVDSVEDGIIKRPWSETS